MDKVCKLISAKVLHDALRAELLLFISCLYLIGGQSSKAHKPAFASNWKISLLLLHHHTYADLLALRARLEIWFKKSQFYHSKWRKLRRCDEGAVWGRCASLSDCLTSLLLIVLMGFLAVWNNFYIARSDRLFALLKIEQQGWNFFCLVATIWHRIRVVLFSKLRRLFFTAPVSLGEFILS